VKAYGGWMYMSTFLDFGTSWSEWLTSRPGRFIPGERAPITNWIGGRVGPRAGLADMEKRKFFPLSGLELRLLSRR
jgi:hypothetical protein